jgi:hypothetical protein
MLKCSQMNEQSCQCWVKNQSFVDGGHLWNIVFLNQHGRLPKKIFSHNMKNFKFLCSWWKVSSRIFYSINSLLRMWHTTNMFINVLGFTFVICYWPKGSIHFIPAFSFLLHQLLVGNATPYSSRNLCH